MLAATVQASREERLRRQQARFRDRGGVFVKEESSNNPLLALLLSKLDRASSVPPPATPSRTIAPAANAVRSQSVAPALPSPRRSPRKSDPAPPAPQASASHQTSPPKPKARIKKKVKKPVSQSKHDAFKLNIKFCSPEKLSAGGRSQTAWKVELARETTTEVVVAEAPASAAKGKGRAAGKEILSVKASPAKAPSSTFDPAITLPTKSALTSPLAPVASTSKAATSPKKKKAVADYVDLSDDEPAPNKTIEATQPVPSTSKGAARKTKRASLASELAQEGPSGPPPVKASPKALPTDVNDILSDDDVPLVRARKTKPEKIENEPMAPPRVTRLRDMGARRRVHFAGAVESCSTGGTKRDHGKTIFGYKKRPEPIEAVPEEDEDADAGDDQGGEEETMVDGGEEGEESMSVGLRKKTGRKRVANGVEKEEGEEEERAGNKGKKSQAQSRRKVVGPENGDEEPPKAKKTKGRKRAEETLTSTDSAEPSTTKKTAGKKRKAAESAEPEGENVAPTSKSSSGTKMRKKELLAASSTPLDADNHDSLADPPKPKSKRARKAPAPDSEDKENASPLRLLTVNPRSIPSRDTAKTVKKKSKTKRDLETESEADPLDCI